MIRRNRQKRSSNELVPFEIAGAGTSDASFWHYNYDLSSNYPQKTSTLPIHSSRSRMQVSLLFSMSGWEIHQKTFILRFSWSVLFSAWLQDKMCLCLKQELIFSRMNSGKHIQPGPEKKKQPVCVTPISNCLGKQLAVKKKLVKLVGLKGLRLDSRRKIRTKKNKL